MYADDVHIHCPQEHPPAHRNSVALKKSKHPPPLRAPAILRLVDHAEEVFIIVDVKDLGCRV